MKKNLFVRLFLLIVLFVLLVSTFPAAAQDEVTPVPTVEATLVAPGDTAPPVVVIDQTQIPTWAVVIILVAVAGLVSVAYVGIVNAAKQAPEWTREIFLSGLGSGLDSVNTYVKTTPTPLDDVAYDELRKLYDQLRADLLTTSAKVEALSRGSSGSG